MGSVRVFLVFDGHKTACQLISSTKRCLVYIIMVYLWNENQLPCVCCFVSHTFVLVCLLREDREGAGSQLEGTSGGHLGPGHTWIRCLLCAVKILFHTSTSLHLLKISHIPFQTEDTGCPGRSWSLLSGDIPPGHVSVSAAPGDPALAGVGLNDLQRSLPTLTILDSVIPLPFHFKVNTWLQKTQI